MQRRLRIAYFAHSVRSDWNNGNAHFLRGLMRSLIALGHDVTILEPERGWSINNLLQEPLGERSLRQFFLAYPDLPIRTYTTLSDFFLIPALRGADIVIVHEWNPPELVQRLLELREQLKFRLLFHDTHHRATSSPDQIRALQLEKFDGILAFGEALRQIYLTTFNLNRVWTLHEAADTSVFRPIPDIGRRSEIIWIGNWGDGERTQELKTYLLCPAARLAGSFFSAYGVRYPPEAIDSLREVRVEYRGYLPNLECPRAYAGAMATIHVPRQAYTAAMSGIPTIRVFEALACGIPLVCAPWNDYERLFREGDYRSVNSTAEMTAALRDLAMDRRAAEQQAQRGYETVLTRHTCMHRAQQLTSICEEILR